MIAVVSTLVVIAFSVLVTRIATILLRHTGMSREMARFQARSAFTGAGFTTSESESVVNHPVRRRIVSTLMLIGNAGIVSAIASLLLAFAEVDDKRWGWLRLGALFAGTAMIWMLARSAWLDRCLARVVAWWVRRNPTLIAIDLENLLQLGNGFRVQKVAVGWEHWLCDRSLSESMLSEEGILILGIQRGDDFLGAPSGESLTRGDDVLICYGPQRALDNLARRRRGSRGDADHRRAAEEQRERRRAQRRQEVAARIGRHKRPRECERRDEERRRGDVEARPAAPGAGTEPLRHRDSEA